MAGKKSEQRIRIDQLKDSLLENLDFAPNAKTAEKLVSLVGRCYKEFEYDLAAQQLSDEGKISEINGWYVKTKPLKLSHLTADDLDWFTGTGRYSQ
jgi:hypothetical protein